MYYLSNTKYNDTKCHILPIFSVPPSMGIREGLRTTFSIWLMSSAYSIIQKSRPINDRGKKFSLYGYPLDDPKLWPYQFTHIELEHIRGYSSLVNSILLKSCNTSLKKKSLSTLTCKDTYHNDGQIWWTHQLTPLIKKLNTYRILIPSTLHVTCMCHANNESGFPRDLKGQTGPFPQIK